MPRRKQTTEDDDAPVVEYPELEDFYQSLGIPWERRLWTVQLYRDDPRDWKGNQLRLGMIDRFNEPVDTEQIAAIYGGGVYHVRVYGPPVGGGPKQIIGQHFGISIGGPPRDAKGEWEEPEQADPPPAPSPGIPPPVTPVVPPWYSQPPPREAAGIGAKDLAGMFTSFAQVFAGQAPRESNTEIAKHLSDQSRRDAEATAKALSEATAAHREAIAKLSSDHQKELENERRRMDDRHKAELERSAASAKLDTMRLEDRLEATVKERDRLQADLGEERRRREDLDKRVHQLELDLVTAKTQAASAAPKDSLGELESALNRAEQFKKLLGVGAAAATTNEATASGPEQFWESLGRENIQRAFGGIVDRVVGPQEQDEPPPPPRQDIVPDSYSRAWEDFKRGGGQGQPPAPQPSPSPPAVEPPRQDGLAAIVAGVEAAAAEGVSPAEFVTKVRGVLQPAQLAAVKAVPFPVLAEKLAAAGHRLSFAGKRLMKESLSLA